MILIYHFRYPPILSFVLQKFYCSFLSSKFRESIEPFDILGKRSVFMNSSIFEDFKSRIRSQLYFVL